MALWRIVSTKTPKSENAKFDYNILLISLRFFRRYALWKVLYHHPHTKSFFSFFSFFYISQKFIMFQQSISHFGWWVNHIRFTTKIWVVFKIWLGCNWWRIWRDLVCTRGSIIGQKSWHFFFLNSNSANVDCIKLGGNIGCGCSICSRKIMGFRRNMC